MYVSRWHLSVCADYNYSEWYSQYHKAKAMICLKFHTAKFSDLSHAVLVPPKQDICSLLVIFWTRSSCMPLVACKAQDAQSCDTTIKAFKDQE